jgi:hypothetical protein
VKGKKVSICKTEPEEYETPKKVIYLVSRQYRLVLREADQTLECRIINE